MTIFTEAGGIWVMAPDGRRIGIIRWPEQAVNFAFGGPDLRTLFCCAHASLYTLRVKAPGNPHPGISWRPGMAAASGRPGRTRTCDNAVMSGTPD